MPRGVGTAGPKGLLAVAALVGCVVLIAAPSASAITFSNPAPIGIFSQQQGEPYPSTIRVKGLEGSVARATVTLSDVSYAAGDHIGALLVGPGGQSTVLMANACAGQVSGFTVTFDDAAPGQLPGSGPCASGRYKPTFLLAHAWFPPAPATPYGATLASFKTVAPNGRWSLYVNSDTNMAAFAGSISGGWRLSLTGPKTGRRAAALAKCRKAPKKKRGKCRARAKKLPA